MTSRERVLTTAAHRQPDRVPADFGGTFVTGMHVSCIAALRRHFGLEDRPVRVIDCGQMLGEVDDELKEILGIDVAGVFRKSTKFGFLAENWKPWRMYDGLEVLVPGGFNVTVDANGDTLLYPQGDLAAPPCARMPKDGYFFDAIVRQEPIDESRLDPRDNLEEFGLISDGEIDYLETEARRARASGRFVIASFGGTALGDIALVPGTSLKHPKGIRDVAEWYMSIRTRRDYIHKVFEGQVEIALRNYERLAPRLKHYVDAVNICGTDFGTQSSQFCSVETFRELWFPYYKRVNDWIHAHTPWKTFKHSCGSVSKLYDAFIECGFDIVNPVQCSAAHMEPEFLKSTFGSRLVFWGGGVDTQKTMPFGSPKDVRREVLARCEVFARSGGFVFNSVHNIQARTPLENILAMLAAVKEFNGEL